MSWNPGKLIDSILSRSEASRERTSLRYGLIWMSCKWRRAAIADKLFVQYGLKVTFQAVHAFFKRATRRGLRRPLGFAAEPPKSKAIEGTVTVAKEADSIYEEARETIRKEQQSRPKIIKPDRPL